MREAVMAMITEEPACATEVQTNVKNNKAAPF